MRGLSRILIDECKSQLLEIKRDILNRARDARTEFRSFEKSGGDEADQTMSVLREHEFLIAQERLRAHLLEVEFALARIEQGRFGICEETDEPIEVERLRALPWTRLSIEGAEIRESVLRRFAR